MKNVISFHLALKLESESRFRHETKAWVPFALGEACQSVIQAKSKYYRGGEFSGILHIFIFSRATTGDTKYFRRQSTIPMISVPASIVGRGRAYGL